MTRAARQHASMLRQIEPRKVYTVSYRCRDIGYGIEDGVIEAFWTGEIDTWGKRTWRQVNGEPPLYLFDDELVDVDATLGSCARCGSPSGVFDETCPECDERREAAK
jgi:hypothetical protein